MGFRIEGLSFRGPDDMARIPSQSNLKSFAVFMDPRRFRIDGFCFKSCLSRL